jgi:hypothetical protein
VATALDLSRTTGNIDLRAEFWLLEVKVSIIFLGMEGFSPRMEGRYNVIEHSQSQSAQRSSNQDPSTKEPLNLELNQTPQRRPQDLPLHPHHLVCQSAPCIDHFVNLTTPLRPIPRFI